MLNNFDKEKKYDERIAPLMTQIIEICKQEKIPFFASFYLKDATEENGAMYCTTNIFDKETNNEPDKHKEMREIAYKRDPAFFCAMTIIKGDVPNAQ